MPTPSYDATTPLRFDLTIQDPDTEAPIDPAQLAFVTEFIPTDPTGTPISHTDIWQSMGSLIVRIGVGSFSVTHDTTPYVAGGELKWAFFAKAGVSAPAQGVKKGAYQINPVGLTDPFA
jgi:hypothetical protein